MALSFSISSDDAKRASDNRTGPVRMALQRVQRTSPLLHFAIMAGLIAVILWPTTVSLLTTWFGPGGHLAHSGALIASGWLLHRHGGFTARYPLTGNWAGLILFSLASLAWLVSRAAGVTLLEQCFFICLLISAYGIIYGLPQTRALAAPLALALLAAPFDDLVLPALQTIATHAVSGMLTLSGIVHTADGFIITTMREAYRGAFEIAEECAGLRYITTIGIAAYVIADLRFARPALRIAFALGAATLGIVMNWLRAYLVIAIATMTSNQGGIAEDHEIVGLMLFAITMIAVVFTAMKVGAPQNASKKTIGQDAQSDWTAQPILLASMLALLAVTGVYERTVVRAPGSPAANAATDLQPPSLSSPWKQALTSTQTHPLSPLLSLDHADRVFNQNYANGAQTVRASFALFAHDRPRHEIAGYDTRHGLIPIYRQAAAQRLALDTDKLRGLPVTIAPTPAGDVVATTHFYWIGDQLYADETGLKKRLIANRMRGAHKAGGVVVLQLTAGSPESANKALVDFITALQITGSPD